MASSEPIPESTALELQNLRDRITQLEQENAALRRAQPLALQPFLDAIPIPIAILDHLGRNVAGNRALDASGQFPQSQPLINAVLQSGQPLVCHPLTSASGLPLSVTLFPLPQPDAPSPLIGAILQDVSQTHKVETALRDAQAALSRQVAEFDALFRALPVGVGVAHDPECRQIRANPALAKLLGMDYTENVSKTRLEDPTAVPFRVISDGREIPPEELPMQVAARTGRDVRDFVYELVRDDGVTLTEYGHATPLFDEAGNITGSIGVFLDFTELRRAQRELELANDELRRSNADLNHFAYAASHDLREPLRTIRLYSQILGRNPNLQPLPDALEGLKQIGLAAARMDQLLSDLMAYVNAATGVTQSPSPINLNTVLEATLQNLQVAITHSQAQVIAVPLPTVAGQQSDFIQIFQNLIGNAIKYRGDAPPLIHITSTQPDPSHWQITIRDNGIGIDPEYTSRIFDLFRRLHGREVEGSGVGLAICRRIVQRYGGRIWVESESGQGSSFCFTIPTV